VNRYFFFFLEGDRGSEIMPSVGKKSNRHIQLILDTLEEGYKPLHPQARFDVYQASRWSIRIRVIERGLAKLDLTERDKPIWDLFEALPEATYQMIGLLFLLDPDELEDSEINEKFESDLAIKLKRQSHAAARKAGKAAAEKASGQAKKARPGRSAG
jgi:hypothetical protein